jgi:putative aldouronate transport system permease protein
VWVFGEAGVMRLTFGDKIYQAVIYTVIIILLLFAVFPLFYVLSTSFISQTEWMESNGRALFPKKPTLAAYNYILQNRGTFFRAFGVSVVRTITGTSLTVFFSMCLGYVLSRKDLPFKSGFMFMTMVTILFGGGLIPTFLVVNATGIYDTLWALVIPGLVDSWSVLVFRQFFINTPDSIEESARIDGAGEIAIMWVIIVPLSKAVIAALTLFAAVGHWNAWFDAAVYLQKIELKPFQLLMRDLMTTNMTLASTTSGSMYDLGRRITPNGIRMAVTVVGVLPILCIYPFLQKYFTKGVYMGAVKE